MKELKDVKGIGEKTSQKLIAGGIQNAKDLSEVDVDEIIALGIGEKTAKKIRENAITLLKGEVDETKSEKEVSSKPVKKKASKKNKVSEKTPKQKKVVSKDETKEATSKKIAKPKKKASEVKKEPDKERSKLKEETSELKEASDKKTAKPKKKKATVKKEKKIEPVEEEDEFDSVFAKRKKGTQVKKVHVEREEVDQSAIENRSTWVVKRKELTEEEKAEKKRQAVLRASAGKITRKVPTPPQPVKAVKEKEKEKTEKPAKKVKTEKASPKKVSVRRRRLNKADFYSPSEIKVQTRVIKPRGVSGESGTPVPRIELEKGAALGYVSSHRRSRRVVQNNTLILQLNPEFDSESLIGKKVRFTYPDNGMDRVGAIYRRFGKRSSRKVLARFDRGVRVESRHQIVYAT